MKRKVTLILFSALLYLPGFITIAHSQSEDRRFHHLTISEGLSQSIVQAIYKDSYGYMWFGTHDGLNRYNGYEFTVYKNIAGDPNSLADNIINTIYEDLQKNLWIGTRVGGLSRFNREKEVFENYTGEAETEGTLSANTIWALFEDSRGTFWVGTGYGLNKMDRETGTFQRIFHDTSDPNSLSSNYISTIYEDENSVVWLGTGEGLNRFDHDTGNFVRYTNYPDQNSDNSLGIVRAVFEDSFGTLWVGTEDNGMFAFDRENERFKQYTHDPDDELSISGNAVFSFQEDRYNNLWIATGNDGVNVFNREQDIFYRYQMDPENPYSINRNGITQLYYSDDDIMWIGTFAGGVNFHELVPEMFGHFANEPQNPGSLSNNVVQAIYQARNGDIWIGTDGGGLNRFNKRAGTFERFGLANHNISNVILDIHETEEGLWLATYGDGVGLFRPDEGDVRYFRYDENNPQSMGSNYIFDIFESPDGMLWFSSNWGGVTKMNPVTKQTQQYTTGPADDDWPVLLNSDARFVFEDSDGEIWIGTYEANLSRLDRENNRFRHYNINHSSNYRASVVQGMYEDTKNRLWLATRGAGLAYFDKESDTIVVYINQDDQLPSNMVHSIVEDKNGALWLGTNNGISRVDIEDREVTNFNLEHGLRNREFAPGSALIDEEDFIYFGGVNGFTLFHPDSIRMDERTHQVVFTELLLFNEPVTIEDDGPLERHISLTNRLILPHTATVITLGYTALNFNTQKGNQFAYKLEGFDEDWNYVGTQRRATYTNLAAGEYEFKVMSANVDGIWSENIASIAIIITPPFWQTTWFLALMLIGISLVITTFYQYRVRRIRLQNIRLEKLVRERTAELQKSNETKNRLFSIISHDLRNYASSFVGFTGLVKDSASDGRLNEVVEYAGYLEQASSQFTDFLKNLLDWARAQTDNIRYQPKSFSLEKVTKHVLEQAGPTALGKQIEIRSEIEPDIVAYADADMVAIVIYNLINNAIKFSEKKSVIDVCIRLKDDNSIELKVQDYGTGMDEETVRKLVSKDEFISRRGTEGEKGTGLGFNLCKDFIKRNSGEILIDSKPGKGTTVICILPADKAHSVSEAS